MEIERKWLIGSCPLDLSQYTCHEIAQGYLCTEPVVRIRRQDEEYILTYKSKGLLVREEYNLPLTREAYEHLLGKIDGICLSKKRYDIPLENGLKIELDYFNAPYENLRIAEIEFPTEEQARAYDGLPWFGEEVTYSSQYHNSVLSQRK